MNNKQLQFLEMLKNLEADCLKPKWELYADFASTIALSMAAVAAQTPVRAEEFCAIQDKYKPSQFDTFRQLFKIASDSYAENRAQDFLGEIITAEQLVDLSDNEQLLSYEEAEKTTCQISTGCELAMLTDGFVGFIDHKCLSGAMSIAVFNSIKKQGYNAPSIAMFSCEDDDPVLAHTCFIQLFLLGATATVRVSDPNEAPNLIEGLFAPEDALCTMEFYGKDWHDRRVKSLIDNAAGVY